MTTITIPISDDRLGKLNEISHEFGVTVDDLIRISIEELLVQPDDKFQRAVNYVLDKNKELYRRLA